MSVWLRMFVLLMLSGCTANSNKDSTIDAGGIGLMGDSGQYVTTGSTGRPDAQSQALGGGRAAISGITDHGVTEGSGVRRRGNGADGGSFSLNFSNTPLQEFVRVVFDEILKENIVIDPALSGNITIRTVEPVTKQVAIELTREALLTSGAQLTKLSGAWRVSAGSGSPGQAGQGRQGRDQVRVIRLRNVSAEDAKQALQPFVGSADLSIAGGGRYIIAGGRQTDLDGIEAALGSFDVDELRGRSFALVPLQQASAPQVAKDLTQMFAAQDGQKRISILPIERMNAVMLVSSNPAWLARAKSCLCGQEPPCRRGCQSPGRHAARPRIRPRWRGCLARTTINAAADRIDWIRRRFCYRGKQSLSHRS
jgi:general secretion pathway protein D